MHRNKTFHIDASACDCTQAAVSVFFKYQGLCTGRKAFLTRLSPAPVSNKVATIRCDSAVTPSDIRSWDVFSREKEATATQLALSVALAISTLTCSSSSPSTGECKSEISVRVCVRMLPTAEATASKTAVSCCQLTRG